MVVSSLRTSGFAVDLGPPPADADEEETPVLKKFGRFAFEGMADELEDPSQDKETESIGPQAMNKDGAEKNQDGNQNGRDAKSMAGPVYGMLMAGGVLCDPLLVGAVA